MILKLDTVKEVFDFRILKSINATLSYYMSRIVLGDSPKRMRNLMIAFLRNYKFSGKLTLDQATSLGFMKWSDEFDIYLLPEWMYCCIDTEEGCFYSIYGEKLKKEDFNCDARFGYLSFGIIPENTYNTLYYYNKSQELLYSANILRGNIPAQINHDESVKNNQVVEIYGLKNVDVSNRILSEVFIKYNDKKYYLQPDGSYKHLGVIK